MTGHAGSYGKGWTSIPNELIATVSDRAVRLFALINMHTGGLDGSAIVALDELADHLGCSDRSLRRASRELKDLGYLIDQKLPTGHIRWTTFMEPIGHVWPEGAQIASPERAPVAGGTSLSLKKGEKRSEQGSRIPKDWKPSSDLWLWTLREAREAAVRVDWERVVDSFRDYWGSIPGQKGVKLGWDGTWRNEVRKQIDWAVEKQPANTDYEWIRGLIDEQIRDLEGRLDV